MPNDKLWLDPAVGAGARRQAWLAVPVARVARVATVTTVTTVTTQSVTHQGSPLPTSDAVQVAVPSPLAAAMLACNLGH